VKKSLLGLLLCASLLDAWFLVTESLWAQERNFLLERILNPLPEYNPFDKPPPPPQFFPDDVDKRARQLLVDSLTNNGETLEGHLQFFKNKDVQLKKESGSVTGLSGHALDLFNNTLRDHSRYLEAQRKALGAASSLEEKQLIEWRLRGDDRTQADELLKKNAANRWGGALNRLLSSVDLVSVVSGSYIGAAVESTMAQLVAFSSAEMPAEERKALALYQEHLKRHSDDPQNGEIRKSIEELEKKRRKVLIQRQLALAQEASSKGDLSKAAFHYEVASIIDPSSREAQRELEQVKKRLQRQEEERKKGLTISNTAAAGPTKIPEEHDLSSLLYALTLRDQEQIGAEANILADKYRGKPLADSARDASAVALEIQGRHEEAKKTLQQIARSSVNPQEKQRAEALLQSPEYNLLASFQEARSQRRLDNVKYVLLGEDLLRKNLLYSAAPIIAAGPVGAASVGAANVLMIGTNLFEVMTSNPISSQDILDKGVAYVRSHPQSDSATEVYKILGQAYEEKGRYDRALAYYRMAGLEDEKKFSELKGTAAKALLQAAERSPDREAKESYLKLILEDFPESAAAQDATQRLSALAKSENQGIRMSKNFLMENPDLYGSQGLRLKPTLFDGNLGNMELAEKGINILSDGQMLLHFQTPWGVRSQSYPIDRESVDRFRMALRQKNYQVALGDASSRDKGSRGGIKNLPLPLIQGGIETKGGLDAKREQPDGESEKTTFTLVREATGSSYSKVLDHQFLSENERDPGSKFKLPPIQGSVSGSGVSLSGGLPAGLWGDRLMLGTDPRSPFAGLQLPIPLLEGFIPVDFLVQGRPGRFSIFPKIHLYQDKGDDKELYR
jgi:hypothetical protein